MLPMPGQSSAAPAPQHSKAQTRIQLGVVQIVGRTVFNVPIFGYIDAIEMSVSNLGGGIEKVTVRASASIGKVKRTRP